MKNKKIQSLKLKRNQKSARYFYELLRAEIEAAQDGKLRVPGLGFLHYQNDEQGS